MLSKTSKRYRNSIVFLTILHLVCLFLPICIFLPEGLTSVDVDKGQKILLSMSSIVCVILLVISLMCSTIHKLSIHKSIIWALLLVMTFTLPTVESFIIWMSICSLIDEIFVVPYRRYCMNKFSINKEIDKRS